ncbi:MAG: hypothetical protein WBA20_18960 [Ketobacter sp.]|nr:MAG: hypothetical protein D6160_08825 [Ketobacter sp.]
MKAILKKTARPYIWISLIMFALSFISGCQKPIDPGPPPQTTPEPTALDEPGSYSVRTFDTGFNNDRGSYGATIYYPEQADNTPAIAFSPGLGARKQYYTWVGNHLASHGYTVLIFTVPMPFTFKTTQHEAGFASAFETLEKENNDPDSPLYTHLDLSKRAIMGHSLGGAATIKAAVYMDLSAAVALAPAINPASSGSNATLSDFPIPGETAVKTPLQIHAANYDCITGDKDAIAFYDALDFSPKQVININGGNHVGFNDASSIANTGGQSFDCSALIDTTDHLQRLSRRYFTAWLDYHLKQDRNVEAYLFGSSAQQDLTSRLLTKMEFELD